MNLFSLEDKTALVIGGSGVIGSALAEGLAGHGARVAVAGRNPAKIDGVVTQLQKMEFSTEGFRCDVTSRVSLASLVKAVLAWGERIDILVNCAGVNSRTPFSEILESEWQEIMDLNAKGVFLACQVVAPEMLAVGGGSIINISSVSSGPPLSGVFTYSASKAAVNSMTQYLARELAPTVRVNAIIPGFFPAEQNRKILTEARIRDICQHTPMARLGDAKELQGAVVWLASPAASGFVTGSLVRVDGGFSAMTI
ncbi:MAG: SDR family oxidoreductase [Firmicutes bacterium]|jgi:NAD(P)-dependent dehydrogenase (short-subunit alcohol dehydrogenase family)|nr:SDR family oxidoreductase [Bacillota bacterium]MCL5064843.1 SDR family oxidoreductase [Bacillota bacterium]